LKTDEAAQVNSSDPIGFVVTVYNTSGGGAAGVCLGDPLPAG
jgi:uncharacterized repeat protein (TIGR01451 family)